MAADGPLVSVIIATYNWSSVLRYAIQSVLWQTFQDFEILVIGDHCTDDSESVAASFGDPRIRWHNLPENAGSQYGPNNQGLVMARGEFIAYLGHDDIWYPTHLKKLVDALQDGGADIGYSLCERIVPDQTGGSVRSIRGALPPEKPWRRHVPPPSAIMHRRALVAQIGPWKDYREIDTPPDKEFVLRAHDHGARFAHMAALTVFKFPSSMRLNSYKEKPSFEQAQYSQRILSEPDFLERELVAIAADYAVGRNAKKRSTIWQRARKLFLAPGSAVEAGRKFRGLPNQLDQPRLRHFIRRLLLWLQKRLGKLSALR